MNLSQTADRSGNGRRHAPHEAEIRAADEVYYALTAGGSSVTTTDVG